MSVEFPSQGGEGSDRKEEGVFNEMERGLQEGQVYLKQTEEKLTELATDLEEAEAELETYISGNEYANEYNLKVLASKEEVEKVKSRIQGIRRSISSMENLQARIINVVDKMEATEERLLYALLQNPTTEPNPDDNI